MKDEVNVAMLNPSSWQSFACTSDSHLKGIMLKEDTLWSISISEI